MKYAKIPLPEYILSESALLDPHCKVPNDYQIIDEYGPGGSAALEVVNVFNGTTSTNCVTVANILLCYDRNQLKNINELRGFFTPICIVRFEYLKHWK